jgi:hypothetical protein
MKKRYILSIVSAILLILSFSLSAGAVQGVLVGPDGIPLEGFSNVYIIDGNPQPVYNFAEHRWYNVFLVGTDENGVPICHVGSDLSTNQEQGLDKGSIETKRHECFSGTTFVLMADGSMKMIKDITAGEKVMGYNLTAGRFTACDVVDNYPTVKNDYYILNGGLKVTAGHPFYARDFGPTPASTRTAPPTTIMTQELKPYSTLYGFNPATGSGIKKLTLNSIVHVKESGTFYNLQVGGTMNFFVSPDGKSFIIAKVKIE